MNADSSRTEVIAARGWRPDAFATVGGPLRTDRAAAQGTAKVATGIAGQVTATAAPHGAPGQPMRAPGGTVWLTGLSGSGKTTLAEAAARVLRRDGRAVEVLDGDDLRAHLSPRLGFTRVDRDAHVARVGYLARLLARHGVLVLVPVIAPYAQARLAVRAEHTAEGLAYLEVHVATPVAECARRDVKGLYAGHAAGRVLHLTGVDDPYEPPDHADRTVDTTGLPVEDGVDVLIDLLRERGLK